MRFYLSLKFIVRNGELSQSLLIEQVFSYRIILDGDRLLHAYKIHGFQHPDFFIVMLPREQER